MPGGFNTPMYVVAIRPMRREVVVGPREELLGQGVVAGEVNWLVDPAPGVGDMVQVRVRHRAPLVRGELIRLDGDELEVALHESVAAIAPGQSLALYDLADRMLGGGFIEKSRSTQRRLAVIAA